MKAKRMDSHYGRWAERAGLMEQKIEDSQAAYLSANRKQNSKIKREINERAGINWNGKGSRTEYIIFILSHHSQDSSWLSTILNSIHY